MARVTGIITANYATAELGTLTQERGVASLPFGGRYRLIDFPLSNLVNSGIDTVGIITPYKYRSLIDHIGSGKPWALDRKNGGLFILPGAVSGISSPGARFTMRDIINNKVYLNRSPADYVVVTASNVICNIDYKGLIDSHIKSGADITMVYTEAKEDNAFLSKLKLDGDAVKGVKRGVRTGDAAFIDSFIISREFLIKLTEWYAALDHLDFFELLEYDYDKMDVRAYRFDGYTGCVFSTDSYFKISMDLLKAEVRQELFNYDRMIMTKVMDSVPSKYLEGAKVSNSYISAGCIVEGTVENCILFRGVEVKKGAVVKNSIIQQACIIEESACVENTIIDRNNRVGAETVIKGTDEDIMVIPKVSY